MAGVSWQRPWRRFISTSLGFRPIYGDGNDGDVTITAAASPVYLSRDMYYNSLTIDASATLVTQNFRIFVKNTLNIASGGTIQMNGTDGTSDGEIPALQPNGTLGPGYQGGGGGWGPSSPDGNGLSGDGAISSLGGSGGVGGAGDGTWSEGFGAAVGAIATTQGGSGIIKGFYGLFRGTLFISIATRVEAGGGGGGGASDISNNVAGSGGNGGGVVFICARKIIAPSGSTISANGGNGSDSLLGDCGGGGGGGGGWIAVYTDTDATTLGWSLAVSGGTGGAGSGIGLDGDNGTKGTALVVGGDL